MATITFLGAAGTVTGSKFLVESGGHRLLVDCGLFQGLKELRLRNWAPPPVDPTSIHAVVLTHAHLDHSGYLPLLVRHGFAGSVYCTAPTLDLTRLILLDAAKVEEEEAARANARGYSKHDPALPLYTARDVKVALERLKPVPPGTWLPLGIGVKARFSPNGHIQGSCFVELELEGSRIVFTGDIGRARPLLLRPPTVLRRADVLVTESTYGGRNHDRERPLHTLGRVVGEVLERKGHLLIPSFAVGRTQDVLFLFSELKRMKHIPDVPVFLDSPMGIEATRIFLRHAAWHRLSEAEATRLASAATMMRSAQASQELTHRKPPTVVLAGSGMVTGGRILGHLARRLGDDRTTVLFTGYQAVGTRGRVLLEGAPEIKIRGEYYPVRARVEDMSSLSAHADQGELLDWLRRCAFKPRLALVVHGEPQSADALRVRLRDEFGWPVFCPTHLEKVQVT